MELKNYFAQDSQGNAQPDAVCHVYAVGTEIHVTGLVDAHGAQLANPFQSDAHGLIQFKAPNGVYDLRVVSGVRDYRIRVQSNDITESIAIIDGVLDTITTISENVVAAADRAAAASDASQLNARVFKDVAIGVASTADGDYFSVPSSSDNEYLILYLNNLGVAVEKKRYPAANTVMRPSWVGKRSGWPDPFFRHLAINEDLGGALRWRSASIAGTINSWSLVANPIFQGRALQKVVDSGTSELSGPVVYLSDIGAAAGDTITIRCLVIGDGATVFFPGRTQSAAHANTDVQKNATPISLVSSDTPQMLSLSFVVAADTSYVRVYPYTTTTGKTFKVVALWAYKGFAADGPSWPAVPDNEVLIDTVNQTKASVSESADRLMSVQAKTEYAITSSHRVVADSESITLNVTNASAGANHTLPFRGWGEIYSPDGVSFNALRAVAIGRAKTADEAKWVKIHVIVKAGGNDGATVAVGTADVDPNSDVLENVTILLKDPTTSAVKHLSDADLGTQYFIGMYAENATGGFAAMGQISATQPNSLGKSYYLTSGAPTGAWMLVNGSNQRIGFQHLLLTKPVEVQVFRPTDEFKAAVAGGQPPSATELLMWAPPKLYVTQGIEGSVYVENLIAADHRDYYWSVSGTAHGQLQDERWTVTPAGAVSAAAMKITGHDKKSGAIVAAATMALVGAVAGAGAGTTRRVMLIGDSFANAGTMTQTLLDLASLDVMGVELIGTRGTGANRHEGRGGWRIDDYATDGRTYYKFTVKGVTVEPAINSTTYSNNGATFTVQELALVAGSGTIVCSMTGVAPSASGTLSKISGAGDASIVFSASSPVSGNPFWFGGVVDFGQYLSTNSLNAPDTVFIELGVNDVFGQATDTTAQARAVEQFALLDTLIASIKAAGVSKVALIPPSGPSSSQDAFGVSYGTTYTRWRIKRNYILWNNALVTRYVGKESAGIFICPAGLNWDTDNNASRAASAPVNSRSSITTERQNNAVHPAPAGYKQIADAMWAFLKCNTL